MMDVAEALVQLVDVADIDDLARCCLEGEEVVSENVHGRRAGVEGGARNEQQRHLWFGRPMQSHKPAQVEQLACDSVDGGEGRLGRGPAGEGGLLLEHGLLPHRGRVEVWVMTGWMLQAARAAGLRGAGCVRSMPHGTSPCLGFRAAHP